MIFLPRTYFLPIKTNKSSVVTIHQEEQYNNDERYQLIWNVRISLYQDDLPRDTLTSLGFKVFSYGGRDRSIPASAATDIKYLGSRYTHICSVGKSNSACQSSTFMLPKILDERLRLPREPHIARDRNTHMREAIDLFFMKPIRPMEAHRP